VAALGTLEAAARIRAKSIRFELAAALDDWALVLSFARPDDGRWEDLLTTARLADPDPWRDQLRVAVTRKDLKLLQELAVSERTASLSPATLVLLSRTLRHAGAVEQAAAKLRRAQPRSRDDFWINEELLRSLSQLKPPAREEALRFATAGLALRPRNPGALLNLGCALAGKGALDEAVAAYREALHLKPDYVQAYCNLGLALRAQGKLSEAGNAYHKALALRPDYAEACNNLGAVFWHQGKVPEALAAYGKAVELQPDYAAAYRNPCGEFAGIPPFAG
jgi:tetratricopeptide (TPR) repeat protein